MAGRIFNVLFLCRDNAARSIMAEAILNRDGAGLFKAYSAGLDPKSEIHPYAAHLLESLEFSTEGLRPKSWDQFAASDAPPLDFVFTVCDDAAASEPPRWPGELIIAHWSMPDPAAAQRNNSMRRFAFVAAFRTLTERISVLIVLRRKRDRELHQDRV